MPFILPKRRGQPPHPKPDRQNQSPVDVSPEWGGTDLPDLKSPDIIPNVFGGRIEGNWSKVADPLDCEAWPSSPYCDLSSTFNPGKFFAVDVAVSVNLCGVSVEVNPTLAWISMPPSVVTWRSSAPDCQPEPPEMDFPPRPGATFYRAPFGHWGCMYRVKATISYPSEISTAWAVDDIWFDCWGPFEGYALHEMPIQTPRGLLYNLSPVFYAHGNAEYYPNYFADPAFPNLRPTTEISFVIFRATAQTTSAEHSIEFEYWEINENMPGRELTNSMASKIAYNKLYCKQPSPVPLLPFLGDGMCNCKAIEADLKAIKKILGADKGGWKVPAKLTGLGTEMVEFNNYAELFLWTIKSFSETLGDTEIKIKLKDANLTQDGNQEQELSYANLGEAVADILGLLLDAKGLSGAIYKASAHGLAQSAVATISAAKTLKIVEDIADFLDYKVEEDEEEIELFLTPTKERPDEYLDKSTQKFSYLKYKGKNSLSTHLHELLFAAALIRSQFWHRVDDEGFARFEDAMEAGQGDLDTFLEKVEQGFPAEPGNIDTSRPYNRPYNERPRVRRISQPSQDGTNP